MKVFRAIEFSKLIWMISDDASLAWNQAHVAHTNRSDAVGSNWWLNQNHSEFRKLVISDVIFNGQDKFFDRSLEFNAMQGGRFNPARSFGVLYTSSDPLMAALEVLYHQFDNAYPLYKKINSSSGLLSSSFNINPPKELDVMLAVFEIEIDDNYCVRELCGDIDALKLDCRSIGFDRYIGDTFNRNFIFGNDYEISRIIGCRLHSEDDPSYRVPSARVDFELQDELRIRNFLIPERHYDASKIDLTGRYIEYRSKISLELNDFDVHDADIEILGQTSMAIKFNLQSVPNKNKPGTQFIRFEPNLNDGNDRKRFFRGVETQRFF